MDAGTDARRHSLTQRGVEELKNKIRIEHPKFQATPTQPNLPMPGKELMDIKAGMDDGFEALLPWEAGGEVALTPLAATAL